MSYDIWIGRAERDPSHLPFVLRGVKLLDDRFANPAYLLLFVTGVALVAVGDTGFEAFWVWSSTVVWVLVMAAAYFGYTPLLRRLILVLDASGPASAEYRAGKQRLSLVGRLLAVGVFVIIILMVFKPTL